MMSRSNHRNLTAFAILTETKPSKKTLFRSQHSMPFCSTITASCHQLNGPLIQSSTLSTRFPVRARRYIVMSLGFSELSAQWSSGVLNSEEVGARNLVHVAVLANDY